MKRFLLAAGTFALVVGLAVGQDRGGRDDRRKAPKGIGEPPAGGKLQFGGKDFPFAGQPDSKNAAPFATWGRPSPAAARRLLPQYEEELELTEAQRDIRKAHVRAAEVAVKAAETQLDLIGTAGNNIPAMERAKARLEVEAARAQLEIKIAEMKEIEVRVKYAKKRLEDAKAAATAPPPAQRGFDPPPVDRPPPPPGGDAR
jgi:hypothetical protein